METRNKTIALITGGMVFLVSAILFLVSLTKKTPEPEEENITWVG